MCGIGKSLGADGYGSHVADRVVDATAMAVSRLHGAHEHSPGSHCLGIVTTFTGCDCPSTERLPLDGLPKDRVLITLPLISNLANVGTQISEFVRFLLPDWDCQSRIVKRTRLRQQAFLPPNATSCFVSMTRPLTMLCKASYFPAEGLLHNTMG